jgi:hypothetical protein
MSMTRSQVESWDPSALTTIGKNWKSMAGDVEGLFTRYKSAVANVNGGHWEGLAAEAALNRAESDRRSAVRVADHLERVGQIAEDGFHSVNPPLQRARDAIAGAERAGFTVSENLTVSRTGTMTQELLNAQAQWQRTITDAANDTEAADTQVKGDLNAERGLLRAAFVSPAGLGADQGTNDARQLLNDPSHLTPEQIQRLIEAGSLTNEQLEALQSGDVVDIPASQMEYLNALARSMDGKSSQEIEDMLNELPADARQGVANALQLLSNPRVNASVQGDRDVPTSGRADLLPEKMYDNLTRDDLTTNSWEIVGRYPYNTWNLNGVADNQAAARIADMADPGLKQGTGLDAAVLDAAAEYLHAQNAADEDDLYWVDGHSGPGRTPDSPLTEEMFQAVADDRPAVAEAVSGREGQALLSDVFTHEWPDNGRAVSDLFDISTQDAIPEAGNGPDEALARNSGDIAESVADYMSDNSNDLLRMPDDTSTSAGERNPDLLRNLADDLGPYYSTFAGSQTIPGVEHFGQRAELADMYSVLATDPEAGVTAAQATYAQELALAFEYGHGAGDAPYTDALIPGQMQDALENGTAAAAATMDRADVYKANWENAVERAGWDTGVIASAVAATAIPGAGVATSNLIYLAGPSLTTDMVGIVDPGAVIDPNNSVPNQEAEKVFNPVQIAEHMVNGYVANDPSVVNHPDLKDLKATDPTTGDIYIDVHNNAGQLQNVIDVLESRGVRVNDWFNWFNTGTNSGAMVVSQR